MPRVTQRSQTAERVVVERETAPASGAFRIDERLRAEQVDLGSDDVISSARIAVRLDNDFSVFEARRRYHPDLRLVVRTDHADPGERIMLFEGYPPRQETPTLIPSPSFSKRSRQRAIFAASGRR